MNFNFKIHQIPIWIVWNGNFLSLSYYFPTNCLYRMEKRYVTFFWMNKKSCSLWQTLSSKRIPQHHKLTYPIVMASIMWFWYQFNNVVCSSLNNLKKNHSFESASNIILIVRPSGLVLHSTTQTVTLSINYKRMISTWIETTNSSTVWTCKPATLKQVLVIFINR